MRTTLRGLIRRYPATSYFALTFLISWGGLVAIVGPSGLVGTKQEFERLIPFAIPAFALGPCIAGIAMTWICEGRSGLHALRARLLKWRVRGRWYAVALLLAPVYFITASLALSVGSSDLLPGIVTAPDKAQFLIGGIAGALVAGVVEELGWTGFATPTLRRRFSPVVTGLLVGVPWGVWHVLPKIWGAAAHGLLDYLPADLACAIVGLTGFRILMVWVYDRTRSLLVSIVMHAALTASTLLLVPLVSGAPLMTFTYITTAIPWLIVAAVAGLQLVSRHRAELSAT
ncbi:MAG TPA: type II CAAX endopeptidase family protein [Kofleriaceae bacterium]